MKALPRYDNIGLPKVWEQVARSYVLEALSWSGSEDTAYNYGNALRQWLVAHPEPWTATTTELRAWIYRPTRKAGVPAPQTARGRLYPVRAFYARAIEAGLLTRNPADGIKTPPEPEPTPRGLTPLEMERVLAAIPTAVRQFTTRTAAKREARNLAVVYVLLYTGLRRREVAHLTAGQLQDAQETREGGWWIRVRVKGGRLCPVYLPPPCRLAITGLLQVRGVRLEFMRPDANVWGGMHVSTVNQIFQRIQRASRVRVTPHAIRHGFTQWLLEAGRILPEVSGLLHHRNMATTHRYATRLLKPKTDYWKAIDEVVRPRKGPHSVAPEPLPFKRRTPKA